MTSRGPLGLAVLLIALLVVGACAVTLAHAETQVGETCTATKGAEPALTLLGDLAAVPFAAVRLDAPRAPVVATLSRVGAALPRGAVASARASRAPPLV